MKKFLLEIVKPVLRHPLFTAMTSILVGSLIVNIILQNRDRDDATFQLKVGLLEESGNLINNVLTREYGIIASEAVDENDIDGLDSLIGLLYKNRMRVKIRDKAYFNNESFYSNYDEILIELNAIDADLTRLQQNKFDTAAQIKTIHTYIDTLQKRWNIMPDSSDSGLGTPYRELNIWTGMVWDKTEQTLSTELDKAIK